MKPLAAFDLEIFNDIEPGNEYVDQGIACAAVALEAPGGTRAIERFYNDTGAVNQPTIKGERMTKNQVSRMLARLRQIAQTHDLVTWNGLGFDLKVVAIESGEWFAAGKLALNHIDPMFNILCVLGYPAGLDQVCQGMGTANKVHAVELNDGTSKTDMSGIAAPAMWRAGEIAAVLNYQVGDVVALLELAKEIRRTRSLKWNSKKGKPQGIPYAFAMATVAEAMEIPLPDTSWMTTPLPRSKFTGWLGQLASKPKPASPSENELLTNWTDKAQP